MQDLSLTVRQREVLEAIRLLGSPTLEELGRHVGMRSSLTVRRHLSNLEAKGLLKPRAKHKHRQIRLADIAA
jgi:DNA-binding MarR family transcriptional regulator